MRRFVLVLFAVAIGALPARMAFAQQCLPVRPHLHPGWTGSDFSLWVIGSREPQVPVGRLCTIALNTPTNEESTRIVPDDLVMTSVSGPITFTTSAPRNVTAERFEGCTAGPGTLRTVHYQQYILTPVTPLPSREEISISAKGKYLLSFNTTDRLDSANCLPHPDPPHAGHCQPPLDACAPGGGYPPGHFDRDAGAPDSNGARPDATDRPATPDAAANVAAAIDAHAPDSATTSAGPRTAASGCAAGGCQRGPANAAVLLAAAGALVVASRRRHRR